MNPMKEVGGGVQWCSCLSIRNSENYLVNGKKGVGGLMRRDDASSCGFVIGGVVRGCADLERERTRNHAEG
jgi:hypothetical protein